MNLSPIKLDLVAIHYAILHKKYSVELASEIKPEYLGDKCREFYADIIRIFTDPRIRDVLSWPSLEDSFQRGQLPLEQIQKYKKIYEYASQLKIDDRPPAAGDFRYYISLIKERQNYKILQESSNQINSLLAVAASAEDINKVLKSAQTRISGLQKTKVYDEGTLGDDALNMLYEYEEIERDPYALRGVMTGYPSFDNLTCGLQKSELTIIAGMEGSGKSALMMNMAVNAWMGSNKPWHKEFIDDGRNIVYFTLEMPRSNRGELTQAAYLNKRLLCNVADVDFQRFRSGRLNADEKQQLRQAALFIKAYDDHKKFYVVDIPRGATVEDIEVKYLEILEKLDSIDLVVIDYLGLMCSDEEADWKEQGAVAGGLHELARTYRFPCLTAAQINRPQGNKGSLDGQKYNTTRIARSAEISRHANNILIIETGDEDIVNEMKVHIAKCRDGKKIILYLVKALDRMKIYEGVPMSPTDSAVSAFEEYQ